MQASTGSNFNSAPPLLPKATLIEATNAAKALLGFYPSMGASDPQTFATGLIQLFSTYCQAVVMRVPSPVNGLPAQFKFMPSIAEIRAQLDDWQEHEERIERLRKPALPPPSRFEVHRPPGDGATVSGLCRKYGIRGVPQGWNAIDVVRGAHQHGENFPAYVDGLLKQGGPAPLPPITQKIKRAMDERMETSPQSGEVKTPARELEELEP